MAGYGPGSPGGGYSSSRNSITISEIQDAISIDPALLEKIDKLERNFEAIMDRLGVLDEPTPERLAKFKQLKEAHDKYKFLEELCGKDES